MFKKRLTALIMSIPLFISNGFLVSKPVKHDIKFRQINKKTKKVKYKSFIDKTEDMKEEQIKKEKEKQRALKELDEWEKEREKQRIKKEKEKKINKINNRTGSNLSRGSRLIEKQATLTFYTNDEGINGGKYTCNGKLVEYGMIASNVYPLGTKIYIPELDKNTIFTVSDRGGTDFNNDDRFDVYMDREIPECGRMNTTIYIIEEVD